MSYEKINILKTTTFYKNRVQKENKSNWCYLNQVMINRKIASLIIKETSYNILIA